MIRLQTDIRISGLNGREVTDFMLNCDDASYEAWWPGVHLQFHTERRLPGDIGNVVYMDEYVGSFRLRVHAVVITVLPGAEIAWQFMWGVRLPGRLSLRLKDESEGVAISHVVEAGFRGSGRMFDPLLRVWLTRDFSDALDEHVRTEFPKLRDLLRRQRSMDERYGQRDRHQASHKHSERGPVSHEVKTSDYSRAPVCVLDSAAGVRLSRAALCRPLRDWLPRRLRNVERATV
jgi:hypothetical protein